jgi:hypothetical protein
MAMKKAALILPLAIALFIASCTSDDSGSKGKEKIPSGLPDDSSTAKDESLEETDPGTVFIAGNEIANEEVLRSIPEEYINKARENFVVSYQHTSHGTHVTRGIYGLPDYKPGDDVLFAVSRDKTEKGKLTVFDNELEEYSPKGVEAVDLSTNETGFVETTRNYLNLPENSDVNVIMWSWCNIKGHDVSGNYLPGMETLISEYGKGGSKIGTGKGMREKPVHFIFMTGHANAGDNVGDGKPKNQADLIIDYCKKNQHFCLDYYSIDTHDMDGNYWEDAGDNGDSKKYGSNFYVDWQNSHELGFDYWENKISPGGDVEYGAHNSQHITANRKGIAFWWILARLAGWDGNTD